MPRPKGSRNQTTQALRDAIEHAFHEVGGKAYLVNLAHEDPKTFAMLLAKIIPKEISVDANVVQHVDKIERSIVSVQHPSGGALEAPN